ncbi:phospholipid scramblase 1, partial [Borealophlyctis nickersoniae]
MSPAYQDVALTPVSDASHAMESEVQAYAEHVSNLLVEDKALWPKYLPITPTNDLFTALQDGVLLSHLINAIRPGSITLSKLSLNINPHHLSAAAPTHPSPTSPPSAATKDFFEATANHNLALDTLKSLPHFVVVNVSSQDLIRKKPDLVLGVIWQLVRAHLVSSVNVPAHPELIRLIDTENGETLSALVGLSSEQ